MNKKGSRELIVTLISLTLFAFLLVAFGRYCFKEGNICHAFFGFGAEKPPSYVKKSLQRFADDINHGSKISIIRIDGYDLIMVPECKEKDTISQGKCAQYPKVCVASVEETGKNPYCKIITKDFEEWDKIQGLEGQCAIKVNYKENDIITLEKEGECTKAEDYLYRE